ncbi:MAG: protein phosphatase 2C domain-containing protein [Pirellulales bacterium]
MWVAVTAFHVPKAGNTESEYEDAFGPTSPVQGHVPSAFRCAIADGASETVFAREWARLLVKAFCRGQFDEVPSEGIRRVQRVWHRTLRGRQLPWYIEAKAEKGAHAAFLGVTVADAANCQPEGVWGALAVGDACLFQVRGGTLIRALPLDTASAFTNRPYLLSTNCESLEDESHHVHSCSGTWMPEDDFYLATDALAQWLLSEQEAGRSPWALLNDLATDAETEPFAQLVSRLREGHAIRNDDTTLVRIDL